MQNVVAECKKMCSFPEEALEETVTLAKCSKNNYKIKDDEGCSNKRLKSQCKKNFIGVRQRSQGSWQSGIKSAKLKASIYLGSYQNAEAAARAYDAAKLCINGSKAILNFPLSSSIAHLSPDTVISPETIKRIAAAAAKNTYFLENAVTHNGGVKLEQD